MVEFLKRLMSSNPICDALLKHQRESAALRECLGRVPSPVYTKVAEARNARVSR